MKIEMSKIIKLIQEKSFQKAELEIRKSLKNLPDSFDLNKALAISLLSQKKYNQSLIAYNKCYELNKNDYDINVNRSLIFNKVQDYKKANIPMMPITNGIESTKKNIFVYSLLMIPAVSLPYIVGFVSEIFLLLGALLTLYYNYLCYQLYKFKKNKFETKKAQQIFGYSILYLFLIFVLFLLDKLILWWLKTIKQKKEI